MKNQSKALDLERKLETEESMTLCDKIAGGLFGILGIASIISGLYLVGNDIYTMTSADEKIRIETTTGLKIPIFLYGYKNKEGKLVEIREHQAWYGAKAVTDFQKTYKEGDKDFSRLVKFFNQNYLGQIKLERRE